jgi:hypothetical protein
MFEDAAELPPGPKKDELLNLAQGYKNLACGGRMNIIETFNRGSTPQYRPPPPTVIRIDTS